MKGLIAGLAALLVLGVGFFLYSSPAAPPAEMTDAEQAQIEVEITDWMDDFLATSKTLDPVQHMALYDQANGSFASGAASGDSPEEYTEFFQSLFGQWASYEAEWLQNRIEIVTSDAVAFQGTAGLVTTDHEAVQSEVNVHFSGFLVKVAGEWKARFFHASS